MVKRIFITDTKLRGFICGICGDTFILHPDEHYYDNAL